MSFIALGLTLISGLFFFIGFQLVKFLKQKKDFNVFGVSLACTIMLGMIFFDIVPEIIEISNEIYMSKWAKIFLIIFYIVVGMGILKIFDHFLPAHHHEHHEKEKNTIEHQSHQYHIGMILAISLIFHNFLEGMSLYLIAKERISNGLLMTLGIGIHNLPLGMEIKNNLIEEKKNQGKKMLLLLIFSSFVGGLFLFLIGSVSQFFNFTLLSITLGMILYLSLFELLHEAMNYRKNKYTYFGIILGIILIIGMNMLA